MSLADLAAIVKRDAETIEENDWALLGEWVTETHYPVDGHCRECGQEWSTYPDFPGCETYLSIRVELGRIVCDRVQRIMTKHRKG